jgi:hypothetical protein
MSTDRNIIDATSGGALIHKTSEAACKLISIMATNSKQFSTHEDFPSKRVNEVGIANLKNKVNDITSLMHSLAYENIQQVKVCSLCSL